MKRIININDRARKISHAEFKNKAWKEFGLGEDNKIYQRGQNSGYCYDEWTQIDIAGIPLDKKLLEEMLAVFIDKKTFLKILAGL